MKTSRVFAICIIAVTAAIFAERAYQRSVTEDAESKLREWISQGPAALSITGGEDFLREHCAAGVSKIEVVDAEWRFVAFRVFDVKGESTLVQMVKDKAGTWSATVSGVSKPQSSAIP